jgi:hypothetical protein
MLGMNSPPPPIDKAESRSIRIQIRHVLLDVWDPIGVKDESKAQDEYDGYIGRLYDLLVSQAPDAELIEYLYWAAHNRMGFDAAQRSDMVSTVEALKRIPLRDIRNQD